MIVALWVSVSHVVAFIVMSTRYSTSSSNSLFLHVIYSVAYQWANRLAVLTVLLFNGFVDLTETRLGVLMRFLCEATSLMLLLAHLYLSLQLRGCLVVGICDIGFAFSQVLVAQRMGVTTRRVCRLVTPRVQWMFINWNIDFPSMFSGTFLLYLFFFNHFWELRGGHFVNCFWSCRPSVTVLSLMLSCLLSSTVVRGLVTAMVIIFLLVWWLSFTISLALQSFIALAKFFLDLGVCCFMNRLSCLSLGSKLTQFFNLRFLHLLFLD